MAEYNRRSRRATPRKKGAGARSKKATPQKPPKRSRSAASRPPKKAAATRKPPEKRSKAEPRISKREIARQKAIAAATRAKAAIASKPLARTNKDRAADARAQGRLRAALDRAGYSPASIASQLGWITRQRTAITQKQAAPSAARAKAALDRLGPPRTKKEKAKHAARVSAYRQALAREGRSPASIAAILGWVQRRQNDRFRGLSQIRMQALGGISLDGRRRDDHHVLQAHLVDKSPEYRAYLEFAEDELGIDYETAVDEWFSPNGE